VADAHDAETVFSASDILPEQYAYASRFRHRYTSGRRFRIAGSQPLAILLGGMRMFIGVKDGRAAASAAS